MSAIDIFSFYHGSNKHDFLGFFFLQIFYFHNSKSTLKIFSKPTFFGTKKCPCNFSSMYSMYTVFSFCEHHLHSRTTQFISVTPHTCAYTHNHSVKESRCLKTGNLFSEHAITLKQLKWVQLIQFL